MFKKTIISEFFTTVSSRQALQSLYLITFWVFKLKRWRDKNLFEKQLLNYLWLKNSKIISFYNGRSAIFHTLKMIWVDREDEVIVNAYNCVSVVNAVLQTWAKIVYSDIEKETLSFDLEILKKNITKNTKVIILQHTFWKLARDYDKIIKYVKGKGILVIEDCAHSLNPPLLCRRGVRGEVWDFLIFSTGRDKVISSITWWFLVINNPRFFNYPLFPSPFGRGVRGEGKNEEPRGGSDEVLKRPSSLLILKNLHYNIVWYLAYKLYDFFKLGRIIIYLSRKLKLITEILTPNEKACNFDDFYLDYPNALAYLAKKELQKLDEYTKIRLENSKYYLENIKNNKIKILFNNLNNYNWFRFPILLDSEKEKNKLVKLAKENNIILWKSWSSINIVPIWTDLKKSKYKLWSCKIAEDISKKVVILPNHKLVSKKDLDRVVKLINNF